MSILSDLSPPSLAVKVIVWAALIGATSAASCYLGYRHEKLVYDNYVLTQKVAAEKQTIANQAALKSQQDAFDAKLNQIHSEYTDNAMHLQASRNAALAAAADYSSQLQRYIASSHQRPSMSDAQGSSAGTDTAGSNGLLDGISSLNWYLTQRFADADALAVKFNEAVQVIAQDREFCNGSLPGISPAQKGD